MDPSTDRYPLRKQCDMQIVLVIAILAVPEINDNEDRAPLLTPNLPTKTIPTEIC